MTDTRFAEAVQRHLAELERVKAEVDAAVPRPRYPTWRRILWRFTGVPYEVGYEARRIGQERANLYFAAFHKLRARDALTGSSDERSENG